MPDTTRPADGEPNDRAQQLLRTLVECYIRDGQPVLPIQEDETALIIWALWQYFQLYHRIEETAPFYRMLVTRPADFLLGYLDPATGLPLPSHDLWEERWGVHTSTPTRVIDRIGS